MLVGYARVSTQDQNLDLQKDALTKDGCQKIFTDVASGAETEREGLAEAIRFLREGDSNARPLMAALGWDRACSWRGGWSRRDVVLLRPQDTRMASGTHMARMTSGCAIRWRRCSIKVSRR